MVAQFASVGTYRNLTSMRVDAYAKKDSPRVARVAVGSELRCFGHREALPFERIMSFIGPNDSGKSSILLLQRCLEYEPLPEADFRDPRFPVVADQACRRIPCGKNSPTGISRPASERMINTI